jgi:hypothetical protein
VLGGQQQPSREQLEGVPHLEGEAVLRDVDLHVRDVRCEM